VFNDEPCNQADFAQAAPAYVDHEHERVKLAAAVVLLVPALYNALDETARNAIVQTLDDYAKHDSSRAISERQELATMLGQFPTEPGKALLRALATNANLGVQEAGLKALGQAEAGLKALGQAEDKDLLSALHHQLRSENFRLQQAAAEALAAIASADSIDALAAIASASDPRMKVEMSIPTRLASLTALYAIAQKTSDDTIRARVITKMLAAVQPEAKDEAILGMRTYTLLGDLHARQELDNLQARLQKKVTRLHAWRHTRNAPEAHTQPEWEELEKVQLARQLAFELAYNIARIDPKERGVSLLAHDLADVRQGAWQGLGRVGDVDLIVTLHGKLQASDHSVFQRLWDPANPFFRHAAYQAIDQMLLRLEATKDVKEADVEKLQQLVGGDGEGLCQQARPEERGICRRVNWTITQLQAKGAMHE
jgi:HEAT repeat protein